MIPNSSYENPTDTLKFIQSLCIKNKLYPLSYKWDENYLISTVWIWIMEISNEPKVWKTVQPFQTYTNILDTNIIRDYKIDKNL